MSTGPHTIDYGTALRSTRIRIEPAVDDVEWVRTAPDPTHPFSSVAVRPLTLATGDRFVVGAGRDLTRTYRLPAAHSLAARVVDGHPEPTDWASVYRGWGRLLAALHDTRRSATNHDRAEPPARTRLRAWWSGTHDVRGDRRAAARSRFLDDLSPGARETVDDVLARRLEASTHVVHGWAGLGHSVLDADGHVVAMIGEDVGHAPPEFDLGALVAQAVELAVFSPVGVAPSPTDMRAALLHGYTEGDPAGDVDHDALADHVVEHVVRHVADFVQFADFAPNEPTRWASLVEWLTGNRHKPSRRAG